ncbi:chloride channel protein [Neisseria sp. CCUG17229]|uniref:chloride channel protein n=1 Tax=Neisseria sp. CCUG17229 TaxID=3392036 RepID=UPI003A103A61
MNVLKLNVRFLSSLLVIGVVAGCIGVLFTVLLHTIQHYAFGYGFLDAHMSFREGVEQATPVRRLWVLLACGLVAGVGWVMVHRYCKPLVEVKNALKGEAMPFRATTWHALLQIVTVGMGSPLGREVAPREMSVAVAEKWSGYRGLSADERRVLLACASGAGLAAVYNVPFAATIFILETLLLSWETPLVVAALMTSGTAAMVTRTVLGDVVQYVVPQIPFEHSLVGWALVAGPLIALGVYAFDRCVLKLPKLPRKSPKMIVLSVACFGLIGAVSMYYPGILGNGKAGNQLTFAALIDWEYATGLLAAKWLAVILAMLAGAYGGRLTPSMMLGGLLGLLFAVAWNVYFPVVPLGAAAFVGAAVFLGLSQKMVLTALVFMLEVSRFSTAYWMPLCVCMVGGLFVYQMLQRKA